MSVNGAVVTNGGVGASQSQKRSPAKRKPMRVLQAIGRFFSPPESIELNESASAVFLEYHEEKEAALPLPSNEPSINSFSALEDKVNMIQEAWEKGALPSPQERHYLVMYRFIQKLREKNPDFDPYSPSEVDGAPSDFFALSAGNLQKKVMKKYEKELNKLCAKNEATLKRNLKAIAKVYLSLRFPSKAQLEQELRQKLRDEQSGGVFDIKAHGAKFKETFKALISKRDKSRARAVSSGVLKAALAEKYLMKSAAQLAEWVMAFRSEKMAFVDYLKKIQAQTLGKSERACEMRALLEQCLSLNEEKQARLNNIADKLSSYEMAYDAFLSEDLFREMNQRYLDEYYDEKYLNYVINILNDENAKKRMAEMRYFSVSGGRSFAYGLGKFFCILYSIGCGVTTAGALMALLPAAPIVLPIFILLAGFLVNYALTRRNTPEVFAYFKQMFHDEFAKFSVGKKCFVAFSAFFCLSSGIVAGVFAYTGAMTIAAMLSLASAAIPPIFGIIAVATALCLATVMFRGIMSASNGNTREKIKAFFRDFIKRRDIKVRDQYGIERLMIESSARYAVRMAFTMLLGFLFFGIVTVGCVFNMYGGYQILCDLLTKMQVFTFAVAQTLAMLPSIFSVIGETKFHLDVAKENSQTLTIRLPEMIHHAREILQGKRAAERGLIITKIILGLVMMKIIIGNIVGNAFPAAMEGGLGGPIFTGVLTAMESALDTVDEWLRLVSALMKSIKNLFFKPKASESTSVAVASDPASSDDKPSPSSGAPAVAAPSSDTSSKAGSSKMPDEALLAQPYLAIRSSASTPSSAISTDLNAREVPVSPALTSLAVAKHDVNSGETEVAATTPLIVMNPAIESRVRQRGLWALPIPAAVSSVAERPQDGVPVLPVATAAA